MRTIMCAMCHDLVFHVYGVRVSFRCGLRTLGTRTSETRKSAIAGLAAWRLEPLQKNDS